jgi:hypothetical protein
MLSWVKEPSRLELIIPIQMMSTKMLLVFKNSGLLDHQLIGAQDNNIYGNLQILPILATHKKFHMNNYQPRWTNTLTVSGLDI